MDLLSEGSSEPRILAARHISGKTLPDVRNNAVNTTLLCYDYSLYPDVGSYVAALGNYAWVIWSLGAVVLAATCLLYAVTLRSARQYWRICITNVAVLLAVYPVVVAASLVAIMVPRTGVLCEALAQEVVMVALYHFFCMIIAECGGPDKLARMSNDTRWQTRVLPCCCWPCCVLPRPKIQTRNLTWLRYTILQMPIIQALIYFVLIVLWTEDMMLYLKSYVFLQPFVVVSILSGMWGIISCIRTVETLGIRARPRFLAIQLALLIVKLQFGMVKTVTGLFELPCVMSLHPAVFVNLIQNCVIILEMLLLSIWACRLYSTPPGKVVDRVQHAVVAVVDDTFAGFDERAMKEGVENKSFKCNSEL